MHREIVLIPGALNTSTLWYNQGGIFKKKSQIHHLNILNSSSIVETAHRFVPIAPKKFTLIGFSIGGYIALELLRFIPENIEKLVLINSSAQPISKKGRCQRKHSIELINKGKFDLLINLIFKNSFFDPMKHKTLSTFLKTMAKEVGAENYKKQLIAILNKPDQSSLLPIIECPTLLLGSRHDKVMPIQSTVYMAQNIKQAKLVYIENAGHLAMLEEPNQVNKILSDWL